ncbi:Maf family nucleotide pyrophosphatase [Terasakiella sp. A23]|uniref:Maf family protein n=1 Tax=Terasakiella sp. FCG-A23 TaxID=3080561 RepID=UPI002955B08B|nr:Maf family nucleotide pyrophosphatase [Terasakiella sp. A23]MDV7339890.1 Maf family nucleotide pyrophosphatase [Terasakiella sp. A23]
MTIILASASKSRADLLRGAGLEIEAIATDLDEDIIKAEGYSVIETALRLSEAKARVLSEKRPDQLVIGADQMMECNGQRFDKPATIDQARDQLKALRGKTHRLISAVAILKGDTCLWSHYQIAELEMRDFSDAFLEGYLDQVGDDVLTTVGGYRLESIGVQLFNRIEGDYFTILGLPLLAALDFLRSLDMIEQ